MDAKNFFRSKTNIATLVALVVSALSACGVHLPDAQVDLYSKLAVALLACGVAIYGRIQAGLRPSEATALFGLVVQTAESLAALLNQSPPVSPSLADASQEPEAASPSAPAEAKAPAQGQGV